MQEIKFKINGMQWYLEIVDANDKGLKIGDDYRIATTHYEEAVIYVQEELFEADESLIRQVLIHEIVHAYQMSYGMLQIEWSEEIVADFIAAHIKSILRTYYEIMSEINNNEYEPKHMAEDYEEYRPIVNWNFLSDIEQHVSQE
jgi:predicted metal-dependent hydrolase